MIHDPYATETVNQPNISTTNLALSLTVVFLPEQYVQQDNDGAQKDEGEPAFPTEHGAPQLG